MGEKKDEVLSFIDDVVEGNEPLRAFEATWGALASFLTDYEHLKGLKNLTQSDVAALAGTTQSAISRLERMKGKPTYELLRRLSDAVGGDFYLTPMAEMTITVPYDLQDAVRKSSEQKGVAVKDYS